MAAKFIASGMKVAYEPRAEVYHSHNLTPSQQFARNRAVGFFLETHADDLMQASEIGEGAGSSGQSPLSFFGKVILAS
mgnify:FL=1